MSRREDTRKLIYNYNRRLQKLKELQALAGLSVDPKTLIEIEDIEAKIAELNAELEAMEDTVYPLPAVSAPQASSNHKPRIFISYKCDISADEAVARAVFDSLSRDYDIFIDQTIPVDTRWAEQIETELGRADFFIVFLSMQSIQSEMVAAEITKAHELAARANGRPTILPVRLAYREPLPYPLSTYLNPINWAFWESDSDTPRLIEELKRAISGGSLVTDTQARKDFLQASQPGVRQPPRAAAQPSPLEAPEGTMNPESAFYVERPADDIALSTIARQGVTITIKAPRQMGKSSLLMRTIDAAAKGGKRVAFLDFQLFDRDALDDADTFFQQFCYWLTDELEMDDQIERYWQMPLGNSQRTTRYVGRYLLQTLKSPLLVAMDEVETIFDTEFRSDFFGMLRSWHNQRRPGAIWRNLDLALVTSTEPYQFISNLNQSPFNVGEVIELTDFSPEQVADLNRRHKSLLTVNQEQQLFNLLNGHPYLTRRALYLIAAKRISIADLFLHAADDQGPFGDHLRHHLFRLHGKDDLVRGLRQALSNKTISDERIFFRLRGAGLVKREGQTVMPRCRLYAEFFQRYLL